jgi:hypothetical protein
VAAPSPAGDGGSERAQRPHCEVADVVRAYGRAFTATHRLSGQQRRVLRAIVQCRTAALGGHVEQCADCGHQRIAYNSCRNRHCPKCQGGERAQWFAAQQALLLPVPYFHVVFTLPHALNALIRLNRRELYALLFRTAAATLQQVATDPKHLGAELGITAVLHTWGQTLTEHVHLHCVVTGGGLRPEGRWVDLPKGRRNRLFLFPVRALSTRFRARFCEGLHTLHAQGKLRLWGPCAPLSGRVEWARYRHTLNSSPWVVYAKPPFGGPAVVLKYLSRYTHRVAIANQRLVAVGDGMVRFRYRDYADHNAPKILTLSAEEFLRRFLLHVLPLGFKRIRHFGLLASRGRADKLRRCRQLLDQHPGVAVGAACDLGTELAPMGDTAPETPPPRCPICGSQHLRIIERLPPIRPGPLLL